MLKFHTFTRMPTQRRLRHLSPASLTTQMGEMQQQVYQVHDVDELKQRMIDLWHGFEQNVISV